MVRHTQAFANIQPCTHTKTCARHTSLNPKSCTNEVNDVRLIQMQTTVQRVRLPESRYVLSTTALQTEEELKQETEKAMDLAIYSRTDWKV